MNFVILSDRIAILSVLDILKPISPQLFSEKI